MRQCRFPSLSSDGAHPGGWRKKLFVRRNSKPYHPFPDSSSPVLGEQGLPYHRSVRTVMKVRLLSSPSFFNPFSPSPKNCCENDSEKGHSLSWPFIVLFFPSQDLNWGGHRFNGQYHKHGHEHTHIPPYAHPIHIPHTPLLTQQFKLRCQPPNCWNRETPEATAPPLPLKSSIPTKIVSLGYITALVFPLSTSKKTFSVPSRWDWASFFPPPFLLFSLFFFLPASPPFKAFI